MSELITALTALFTFLFSQLTQFANFFTTTTLGQVILGIIIFTLIIKLIVYLINR